jgi:hypothetical protein
MFANRTLDAMDKPVKGLWASIYDLAALFMCNRPWALRLRLEELPAGHLTGKMPVPQDWATHYCE